MEAIALEHEDGVALRGGDPAPVRKLRVCESLVQHERRAARRVREVDDGGDDRVAHVLLCAASRRLARDAS